MSITELSIKVKYIAGAFVPGGEDKALRERNLSALPAPSGRDAPFFYAPDGVNAINSTTTLGSTPNVVELPTSLDKGKHLGIFEKQLPEKDVDPWWGEKRKGLLEAQKRIAEVLRKAGRWSESYAVEDCSTEFHAFKARCCGDTIAIPHSCNHRLCPICMQRRSAELSERVNGYIIRMKQPKFITLTIKNVRAVDKKYFSWVRGCFTKLRHRNIFAKCLGGVYTMETTYNNTDRTWHVHLHMVVDAPFIPVEELSSEWKKITKASFIVDIRKVGKGGQSVNSAAKELGKYVVKPDKFLLEPDLVNEYLNAVKGMRLFQVFGHCLGMELDEEEAFSLPDCWCGLNQWVFAGWYIPLADVYRDRQGCYRLRSP